MEAAGALRADGAGCVLSGRHSPNQFYRSRSLCRLPGVAGHPTPPNCRDFPSLNTRARAPRHSRVMETLGQTRPWDRSLKPGLGGPGPRTQLPSQPRGRRASPKPAPPGTEASRDRRGQRLGATEASRGPGGRRRRPERQAGMQRGSRSPKTRGPEETTAEGRGGEGCGRRL